MARVGHCRILRAKAIRRVYDALFHSRDADAEGDGQLACIDEAQGFGQHRVPRRFTRNPTKLRLATPGQTASAKKQRLRAAPSAQQRADDVQDRPPVILPLLAAPVRTLPANSFQSAIAKASPIRPSPKGRLFES